MSPPPAETNKLGFSNTRKSGSIHMDGDESHRAELTANINGMAVSAERKAKPGSSRTRLLSISELIMPRRTDSMANKISGPNEAANKNQLKLSMNETHVRLTLIRAEK